MAQAATPPKFGDVTLNCVCDAGHNARPFRWYADEVKKLTGITINLIEIPFSDVYQKEKTEFVAGSGAFDVVVFYPAYIGDFAGNGYLVQLDQYASKGGAWDPQLDDIFPPFLELYCKWGGNLFALPYDGDVHSYYYRKDIFNHPDEQAAFKQKYNKDLKPAETWDDYLQIAEFFTRKKGEKLAGQTLTENFYGAAEYGQKDFGFAWFLDRFAAFGKLYFDEKMTPQINGDEGVKALDNLVKSIKFSPPDVLSYGYDELRDAFILHANVAHMVQWGDVAKKGADDTQSKVVGKIGYGQVPGWNIGGKVVKRAMMPVGRVLAVTKTCKNPDAGYWLAKYLSLDKGLTDVSTSQTGLDPYRKSHLEHPEAYQMFGDPKDAKEYLADDVEANLQIGYPEIFIPGAAQYEDALGLNVSKAISGQMGTKEALDATAKAWNDITDKLGRDNQAKFWQSSLESYKKVGLLPS